jgi:hypothetical protein
MDKNNDRNRDNQRSRGYREPDYRTFENFGNDRRGSDRDQANYSIRNDREQHYGSRRDMDGRGGNDQHDWNRNLDDSRRDTQRSEGQTHSFAYTDHYEDGPHYHGSFDTPDSPDRRDRRQDFQPLNGSYTNTVDRGQNEDRPQARPREQGNFREIDRDANRDLNFREHREQPRTSSLYGSRANDMSRGMNPYGYGLGDSNYNDTYYGRDRESFSRGQNRNQEEGGTWEAMKDSVKSFFGKGPKGYKRADDRIHEDVCEVLARHPGIDASEIEVQVKDGHVFLKGEVDSRFTKRRAEEVIDHISGVHDVRNELTVRRQDVEGGRSMRAGSGTGTSLGATSPTNNQSGAALMNESDAGSDTAFGSTGTAGTTGSAVNAGTSEGDGFAKRGERDLHSGLH